jgi:hypothetical protein
MQGLAPDMAFARDMCRVCVRCMEVQPMPYVSRVMCIVLAGYEWSLVYGVWYRQKSDYILINNAPAVVRVGCVCCNFSYEAGGTVYLGGQAGQDSASLALARASVLFDRMASLGQCRALAGCRAFTGMRARQTKQISNGCKVFMRRKDSYMVEVRPRRQRRVMLCGAGW